MKQTYTTVSCLCPVCRTFLGTRKSDETALFTNDPECDWDWRFYSNGKKPLAVARLKKGKLCGCGGCKARDGRE